MRVNENQDTPLDPQVLAARHGIAAPVIEVHSRQVIVGSVRWSVLGGSVLQIRVECETKRPRLLSYGDHDVFLDAGEGSRNTNPEDDLATHITLEGYEIRMCEATKWGVTLIAVPDGTPAEPHERAAAWHNPDLLTA